MKTLRIFISSPGDVAEERERARQVVHSLRRRYANRIGLQPIFWEDMPLSAHRSFQQGIDQVLSDDNGVDIAVFILWSRLGTPPGPQLQRVDGTEYRSGTERELALMVEASRLQGGRRPHILAYTRQDEASFEEALRGKSTDQKSELLRQKLMVERFIKEEFHDASSGTNIRAYHTFNRPQTFAARFRAHLQELIDGICADRGSTPSWDIETKGPPFRGLEAFDFEHAEIFFGREDEVAEARARIVEAARRGTAFLLITGASGTGKSSLAAAGLAPEIVANEIDETVSRWLRVTVSPSEVAGDVATGFARALIRSVPGLADRMSALDMAQGLAENPVIATKLALIPALKSAVGDGTPTGARLLVIVDQLEEVFNDASFTTKDRDTFAAILRALASSGQVWVVATLRGDWYQRFLECPDLVALKAEGAQLDVVPPDVDAIRRIIESPAAAAGLEFERPGGKCLSDLILRDVAGSPELLPLLEDFLRELFERRTSDGVLTLSAFESLGGIEGALARRAESSLSSLPIEAQLALPIVLGLLVAPATEDADFPSRRWVSLEAFPDGSPARHLVNRLITDRLVTAASREGGPPEVAIAHEAIPRVWPRAAAWLSENAEFLRMRDRLGARMRDGSPLGEDDPLLATARALLQTRRDALAPDLAKYIEIQVAAIDRRRESTARRRRQVLASLSILSVVAIVTAATATWQWKHAIKAKIASDEAATRADRARADAEELINFMTFDLAQRLKALDQDTLANYLLAELIDYHRKRISQLQEMHEFKNQSVEGYRQLAATQVMLGEAFLSKQNTVEARRSFETALEAFQRINEADPIQGLDDMAITHQNLSICSTAEGNQNLAETHAREYVALMEASARQDPSRLQRVARAQRYLGDLLLDQGHVPEARNFLTTAVGTFKSLAEKTPSDPKLRIEEARTLSALGEADLASGDHQSAKSNYELALKGYESATTEGADGHRIQEDILEVNFRLGRILANLGDLARGTECLERCTAIINTLLTPEEQSRSRLLAQVKSDLGDVARVAGDRVLAIDQYRVSLAIWQCIAQLSPDDQAARLGLADIHYVLAGVLLDDENHESAKANYEQALAVIRDSREQPPPNTAQLRMEADVLKGLAAVAEATDEPAVAEDHFSKSLAILETLVAAEPGNFELLQDLAKGFHLLGSLAAKTGASDAASKHYLSALSIGEKLAELDPENLERQQDLAVNRDDLGDLATKAGRMDEARQYFSGALAIREQLAIERPNDRDVCRALVLSLMRIAAANGACPSEIARQQLARARDLASTLWTRHSIAEDKELLIDLHGLVAACQRERGEDAAAEESDKRIAELKSQPITP